MITAYHTMTPLITKCISISLFKKKSLKKHIQLNVLPTSKVLKLKQYEVSPMMNGHKSVNITVKNVFIQF